MVDGAKILGLFAHSSESHFEVMQSLMLELAKREHNVRECNTLPNYSVSFQSFCI